MGGVIVDALPDLDADMRAAMLEDVVVVGGSAVLESFSDRLEEDLKGMLPEGMGRRVDVRVAGAQELRYRFVIYAGLAVRLINRARTTVASIYIIHSTHHRVLR